MDPEIVIEDMDLDEAGAAEAADAAEETARMEFEAVLRAEYEAARDYIDNEVSPEREKAAKYYLGAPFGDEEDGRSAVVLTEVRDKVLAMLPSLVRVFTSGERVVEYAPRNEEDVAAAEQATDYINYLLDADGNNAFKLIYECLKDGLLKKTGVLQWYWDEYYETSEDTYSGISMDQAQALRTDPEVEILEESVEQNLPEALQDPALPPDLAAELAMLAEPVVKLRIRRTRKSGKLCVECVPPEQLLISREATNEDDATLIGRRRLARVSELVEMGYDREVIERNAGQNDPYLWNSEALIRNPGLERPVADSPDMSQKFVLYFDGLLRYDSDGDGVAELHHVRAVGDPCEILADEIVSDVNYAIFCPNPEPHAVIGQSVADETMDLQFIKSHIMRATLDSLANSIFPSLGVVEGAVEMDDALNTERGRIIRMKAPGMVQSLSEPFIGVQALGVLGYLDDIAAARTGITKQSQGLDADVLQSTTKAAVTATLSAAQERMEMIARIFAEIPMRRLFRGLLRTIARHQDKPRMVRLRNNWVAIDPRTWNVEMDVVVTVGLGRGDEMQKMQFLTSVAGKQEQILQTLGLANPMVGIDQLRNTYAEMLRLAGYKDASRYFRPIDPQMAQQMAQQQGQGQQQQQDPAVLLAQVEAQKIQKDIEIAGAKMALETQKAQAEDDRARDKNEGELYLKALEIQAKYGAQVELGTLNAIFTHQRDQQKNAMQSQQPQQSQIPPQGVQ
jgi:hypothetical protein